MVGQELYHNYMADNLYKSRFTNIILTTIDTNEGGDWDR